MLKTLFFVGLAWLALGPVRNRANGDFIVGLTDLLRSWANAVHPPHDPVFERLARAWPALLPITFLAALSYARSSYGVLTGDGFAWISEARQLDPAVPATFVHPFYNFGWPAVLRIGQELGLDELNTARLASAGLAVMAVLFACLIARWSTPPRVFTCTALSVAPFIAQFAALGSTDLPAAAFQLGAIWFALDTRRWSSLAAGVFIGIGFLFRHQALVLVVPLGAAMVIRPGNRASRIALFAVGLLTAASPQLIANALTTGNALWSEQTKNILFGISGGGTARDWAAFPTGAAPSLYAVLAQPRTVVHWIKEFLGVPRIFLTSLVAFASLALPYRRYRRAALSVIGVSYCLPIAVAWIEPRFILVATAATSFIDGYWMVTLAAVFRETVLRPLESTFRRRVADLVLIAVGFGNAAHSVWSPPVDSKASLYDAVSACLAKQGITNPQSILTFSPVQVDVRRGTPYESFVVPPVSEPIRSIELVTDPGTTTILITPAFLPSNETVRNEITAALAANFKATCDARSIDDELEVIVFSRHHDPRLRSQEASD